MDDLELDQETGIWRPRRRTFIFLLGAAAVGTVLGPAGQVVAGPEPDWGIFPGVGVYGAAKFMKEVYGKGWYLGRDGKRVYRQEIAERNRTRGREAMNPRASRIWTP